MNDAPTTPAEIVEAIGHERGFTVETYVTVWLAGAAAGGPQILLRSGPITLISGSKVRVLVRPPTINDLVALRPVTKEYLATLDDAAFGAASDVAPKFVSPSDPAPNGRELYADRRSLPIPTII